jgi:hypothetical protein
MDFARRVDGPPDYQRFGEIDDRAGKIPGLGRGRFRVTASPVMGGARLLDRDFDVDGSTDVPIVLDVK